MSVELYNALVALNQSLSASAEDYLYKFFYQPIKVILYVILSIIMLYLAFLATRYVFRKVTHAFYHLILAICDVCHIETKKFKAKVACYKTALASVKPLSGIIANAFRSIFGLAKKDSRICQDAIDHDALVVPEKYEPTGIKK